MGIGLWVMAQSVDGCWAEFGPKLIWLEPSPLMDDLETVTGFFGPGGQSCVEFFKLFFFVPSSIVFEARGQPNSTSMGYQVVNPESFKNFPFSD